MNHLEMPAELPKNPDFSDSLTDLFPPFPYGWTLGLDIGTTSIGWSVLPNGPNRRPISLAAAGVRLFPDGRDAKSKEPTNVTRRSARGHRKNLLRRKRRKEALATLLESVGMVPPISDTAACGRFHLLEPLRCRAAAARHPVQGPVLGRALMHICSQRGFKSNRKTDKEDKEASNMKASIRALEARLEGLTLGQYLYERRKAALPTRFRPTGEASGKNEWDWGYPSRDLAEAELAKILETQKTKHPQLADPDFVARLKRIIIDQRPLKTPCPGRCTHDENLRRGHRALPALQSVRIWSDLHNLRVRDADGLSLTIALEKKREMFDLLTGRTQPQKKGPALSSKGVLTFSVIRQKILGLDRGHTLNLESSSREGILCDPLAVGLSLPACFGPRWHDLPLQARTEIVKRIITDEDDEELEAWLQERGKLTPGQAAAASRLEFPDGYALFAPETAEKLLPHLEAGLPYDQACESAGFHHSWKVTQPLDFLPYYGEILRESVVNDDPGADPHSAPELHYGRIANPTVHIALNQLRVIVNALIRRYGKPARIVVETARDLPLGAKARNEHERRITDDRKKNAAIDDALLDLERSEGVRFPRHKSGNGFSRDIRDRFRLWEEQGKICPFSGKPISASELFSTGGDIEVEHILPRCRTFDNSRANKVLCHRAWNRLKGNRTPAEAFGADPEWPNILARADKLPDNKKWRFLPDAMSRFEAEGAEDLLSYVLNDTRYISRIAMRYLRPICTGHDVFATTGRLTAVLRRTWGLHNLFSQDPTEQKTKDRGDHRHHAVDAFITGCASRDLLQTVAAAIKSTDELIPNASLTKAIADVPPWPGYSRNEVIQRLMRIIPSHKPDNHLPSGQILNATNYGQDSGKDLSKLVEIRHTPATCPKNLGRWAEPNANWSLDIISHRSKKGAAVFRACAVSLFDAVSGGVKGPPSWKGEFPEASFLLRLQKQDHVCLIDEDGVSALYRVIGIRTDGRVNLIPIHLVATSYKNWTSILTPFKTKRLQKVNVTPLGDIRPAKRR